MQSIKKPDELLGEMIKAYETEYLAQTGVKKNLKPADPERIELISLLPMFYQLYELIEYNSRMNFLKWAEGQYLDELGALLDVVRLKPQKAQTRMRFELSKVATEMMVIPAGIRVSDGTEIFFQTTQVTMIQQGDKSAEVEVEALTAGLSGNGFAVRQLNTLVDPLPYVASVENIEQSQGGADLENDDRLRERIYLKPDRFSTAGPATAYIYFAKSYSQAISDVNVDSPTPGVVDMRILLAGGQLPNETFLSGLKESMRDQRPLTDHLVIAAPDVVNFNLTLTYYIAAEKQASVESIKTAIKNALQVYTVNQANRIGKDIVPDEIVKICLDNDAKRVEITEPIFTKVNQSTVAKCLKTTIRFGGVER